MSEFLPTDPPSIANLIAAPLLKEIAELEYRRREVYSKCLQFCAQADRSALMLHQYSYVIGHVMDIPAKVLSLAEQKMARQRYSEKVWMALAAEEYELRGRVAKLRVFGDEAATN